MILCCLLVFIISCGNGDNNNNNAPAADDQVNDNNINNDELLKHMIASNSNEVRSFGEAIVKCGYKSHNTLPDSWSFITLHSGGKQLAAAWTPPFWERVNTGLYDQTDILYDPRRPGNKVLLMGGTKFNFTCTPQNINNFLVDQMKATGSQNINILFRDTHVKDIQVMKFPAERFVATWTDKGDNLIGVIDSIVIGENTLEVQACTMTILGIVSLRNDFSGLCNEVQVLNSVKQADKDGNFKCVKPDCSKKMKGQGHKGGFCNSFDECTAMD